MSQYSSRGMLVILATIGAQLTDIPVQPGPPRVRVWIVQACLHLITLSVREIKACLLSMDD